MAGRHALVRWSGAQPVDAESMMRALGDRALDGTPWANGPGERYPPHAHPYDKTLIVLEGSIEMILPAEETSIRLGPGDRLELPANMLHAAVVGEHGVVCWEARRFQESSGGAGRESGRGA